MSQGAPQLADGRAERRADGSRTRSTVAAPIGSAVVALALLPFTLITDYRVRRGVSALIPELCAYLAMLALVAARRSAPAGRSRPSLWLAFLGFGAGMAARAFYFRLFALPDVESSFSRLRDTAVPMALALCALWRMRVSAPARRLLAGAFLVAAVASAAIGIIQFFTGRLYLTEALEITDFKTRVAQKYYIAELFHLDVKQIARGFQGFAISYAFSLFVPCAVAFCYAWKRGPALLRLAAAAAFSIIYVGIYLSFSRSVLGVLPFALVLAVRAMQGKLDTLTCAAVVLGYIGVAFVAPNVAPSLFGNEDVGTLRDRTNTILGYVREVHRNREVLWVGSTVSKWSEWESIWPHNFLVASLLADGLPATTLRIGFYLGVFAVLFPCRRGRRAEPLAAGLWCGAFSLLFVVGETEPFSGIKEYLDITCALAFLAATAAEPPGEALARLD